MRLPSKYLVQQVEYNESKTSVREVRSWAGEAFFAASRLESIRREAYSKISRIFCYVEEYGTWIAVSDLAVEEAKKVSAFVVEELRKLGLDHFAERYTVKAIQVYLAPEDAKELLHAAVSHLSADVEELKQKIAEAEREQNKAALRRLEREKSYREALLAALRNYLAQLG
jgi:pyruvate dehydrogenase complex dehydrogenase (E1) component